MAKGKQVMRFVCDKCGHEALKWAGQCEGCGEWNTLVETLMVSRTGSVGKGLANKKTGKKPVRLSEVKGSGYQRVKTGIGELDRVLGGGLVPGSVVLLAGEPGIGKSTLLTQLAMFLGSADSKTVGTEPTVLYVCGEESPEQIKMRIDRLVTKKSSELRRSSELKLLSSEPLLSFLAETDVDEVVATIESLVSLPDLVIVDSVQTMNTEDLTGMAGSVGQVRECSHRLLNMAKKLGISVILVGHVTKKGSIAGPKVLEHLVDTVLYLEGDKKHTFRILRASKNRFGSVDEVGVFFDE